MACTGTGRALLHPVTTAESVRIKELERENRELRWANEMVDSTDE